MERMYREAVIIQFKSLLGNVLGATEEGRTVVVPADISTILPQNTGQRCYC
jgi:hypothetical protein